MEGVALGMELYSTGAWVHDKNLVKSHSGLAEQALFDVMEAVNSGAICDPAYLNEKSILAISNVVLSGSNTTNDPQIYNLGMMVYNNKYNPPAPPKAAEPLIPGVEPAAAESTVPVRR